MKSLPVTYLYRRLLALHARAKVKGDRAAMLILASRLNALAAGS